LLYLVEESSHASAVVSDRVWNTIQQTELRWDTDVSTTLLHDEHWLSLVSDLELILLVEILGNTDLSSIVHLKEGGGWSLIELDVLHNVCSLRSIVGNDTASCELLSASILECVELS
jgi:hypothetical protein